MKNTDEISQLHYEKFMAKEFPKGSHPSPRKLMGQLDRLTFFILEWGNLIIENNPAQLQEIQLNTLQTLVANYRMRTTNFLNSLEIFETANGDLIYDEATPNILVRSMLENYLVFYYLFDHSDLEELKIRYKLFDLSSHLQFKKVTEHLELSNPQKIKFKSKEIETWINMAVEILMKDKLYPTLSSDMKKTLRKVKELKKDYFKPISFEELIKLSPLPTKFTLNQYSLCSSFAHSELFGLKFSQMVLQHASRKDPKVYELSQFRLLTFAVYITSTYVESLRNYNVEFEDKKELELIEMFALVNFYSSASKAND